MPAFDGKILDGDPDGLAFLAAVLQPTREARAAALERGRKRLEEAVSTADAMTSSPCSRHLVETRTP